MNTGRGPARARIDTCEPLVACAQSRGGRTPAPVHPTKQPTTPGGRVCLPDNTQKKFPKRWEGGGGGGANLMYNIPSPKEPAVAQTRNATEAVRAYRVWRRVGVPNGGTKQKSRAGGRLAASNRPPARGRWRDTLVSPTTIYCRLAAT